MAKNQIKDAEYKTISEVSLDEAFLRAWPGAESSNSRVYARDISTGTMRGEQQLGDKNVKIDSSNRRIIIYDENDDARVLIGFDEDGF